MPLPTTFAPLPEGGWRLRGSAGRGNPEGRDAQALGRLARVLAERTTGRVTVSARVSDPTDDPPVARRNSLAAAQAVKHTLEAGGLSGTRIDLRPLGHEAGTEAEDSVDLVPPVDQPPCQCGANPMTRPRRYLLRMVGFLLAVVAIVAALHMVLLSAFAANPVLNGVILAVLLLGVGWNLRQVMALGREVDWLEEFREPTRGAPTGAPPRLLAPMASMLAARGDRRLSLSAPAMRSVLDGIGSRLDEERELSRYMTGLLIFLGLLGTFWGLILTIGAVADVIGNMSLGAGDVNALFNQLKSGLARPLTGMSLAFSSSMLGLAGALVLGFLDLTAGQAQGRFFNELEEWLAGVTRLSSGVLGSEGEGGSVPAYLQALLEQTADNLETLQRTVARGEEGRAGTGQALMTLTERLSVLTEQMRASQTLMQRLAEAQFNLNPLLQRMGEAAGHDEASRGHLRNIELYLARVLENSSQGRAQATHEIRSEIKLLARTIAALAEAPPQ